MASKIFQSRRLVFLDGVACSQSPPRARRNRSRQQLPPTPYNTTTLSHPREATRSPANLSPSTTMHSNHKPHSSRSSPSSHNNGPAQTLLAPPNPKDPRSYPTPSTSTLHTQTTHSLPPDSQGKLRYHSFSSSIGDIHESQPGNQNGWQQIKRTKRKRLLNSHPPIQLLQTETRNRYAMLMDDCCHPEASEKLHPPPSPKLPPIFLHGVINYTEMIKSLSEVSAIEQFLTKSLANNVIKLVCTTPETHRAIIKPCKFKTSPITRTN